jgi:hypothetical protein
MLSIVDDGTDSLGEAVHMDQEQIERMRASRGAASEEQMKESWGNAVSTAEELLNRFDGFSCKSFWRCIRAIFHTIK